LEPLLGRRSYAPIDYTTLTLFRLGCSDSEPKPCQKQRDLGVGM